jgi:hypothetical protein
VGSRLGLSPNPSYIHLPYDPNTWSGMGLKLHMDHAYIDMFHIVDHCNRCPQLAWGHGHMTHAPNTSTSLGAKSPNCVTFSHNLWKQVHFMGLGMGNSQNLGYSHRGAIWKTRDYKLEEENLQEVYLLRFLAKPGAERSQLGVFGCSEAIGIVFKGILRLLLQFFLQGSSIELQGARATSEGGHVQESQSPFSVTK